MPRRKKEIKVPEPRQLPSGKWFIQLRLKDDDGKQKSVSITEESYDICIAKARAVKAGIAEVKSKKTAPKLGAVIDKYISEKEAVLSPSTIKAYMSYRKNRFQSYMDKSIDTINWQRMISAEAKDVNPKTVFNAWSLVAASLEYHSGTKPKVSLPQQIPNEHPFLSYDQILVFKKKISGKPFEIAALLGLNSLRFSEIKGLTWKDIDLDNLEIKVSGSMVRNKNNELVYKKTNKNKSSNRTVPILHEELIAALKAVKDKSGYVVSLTEMQLYKAVNDICEECGFPKIGCHGLRHSYASALFYMGIPSDFIQRWGGWIEKDTMERIYTHITQDHNTKMANAVRDGFKEQNANENANVSCETSWYQPL